MFKSIKAITSLIFFNIILADILAANELGLSWEGEKKYEISVCAIFKDEALYLKKWIDYHISAGIDHFYLYNIGSRDRHREVLKPYIQKNIVTLVNWPEALPYNQDNAATWALSTQLPAYENAVNFIARDETQWLLFLDINEFLVLPKKDVKKILSKYCEFPGIVIHSEFSDTEPHKNLSAKALRNEFEVNDFPLEVLDKAVTKVIFKPDHCVGFQWPPYQCRFKESESCCEADPVELRIHRCINRRFVNALYDDAHIGNEDGPKQGVPQRMKQKVYHPMYECVPEFLKKLKNNKDPIQFPCTKDFDL